MLLEVTSITLAEAILTTFVTLLIIYCVLLFLIKTRLETTVERLIESQNELIVKHNKLVDDVEAIANRGENNHLNGVLNELKSQTDYVFIEVLRSEDSDNDKMGMLQTALEKALEDEDYERAAEIRDAIEEAKKEDGGQPPKKK